MEKDKQIQVVTFQLGEEVYAIDIMEIKQIVNMQEVREIPNAPPYVEGILNLRGLVTPIINLHKRFVLKKLEMSEEDRLLSGFIILEINNMTLGVIIDKVLRVISLDINLIQPPPQMISGIGVEYIQGVVNVDDNYIIILNIEKLFNPKELQQLSSIK
ncbi:MAG: chemotaxis protein CheW [Spirochaetales bacterium]|nr:chemotaxis protein CheW [Spirochaetales bacterium]